MSRTQCTLCIHAIVRGGQPTACDAVESHIGGDDLVRAVADILWRLAPLSRCGVFRPYPGLGQPDAYRAQDLPDLEDFGAPPFLWIPPRAAGAELIVGGRRKRIRCLAPGEVLRAEVDDGMMPLVCPGCGAHDEAPSNWFLPVCSAGCGSTMVLDVSRRLAGGSREEV